MPTLAGREGRKAAKEGGRQGGRVGGVGERERERLEAVSSVTLSIAAIKTE